MTHYIDDNNEYDLEQARFERPPEVRYWNGRSWVYSYPRDPDYARRLADFEENGIEAYDGE